MNNSVYIPETIKVGTVDRKDTYTKKLAYIIYYDSKGKLRKEKSWQSWLNYNKSKDTGADFKNVPMEGFVLNKDAGGYSGGHYDWGRQLKIRIYDPRGFEFEIDAPNLLYILQNTDCLKGKGLSGEFVYGWDGTELMLIPTSAPEYAKLTKYSDLMNGKSISAKDLVKGGTYLTNKNKKSIYLGRYELWDTDWKNNYKPYSKGKKHWFKEGDYIVHKSSTSGYLISVVSDIPVDNYAEIMDKVEHSTDYSPLDESKDEYIPITKEVAKDLYEKNCLKFYFTYNGKKCSGGYRKPYYHYEHKPDFRYDCENNKNRDSYYIGGYSWNYIKPDPSYKEFTEYTNGLAKDVKTIDDFMVIVETLGLTYRKRYLRNGYETQD